MDDNAGRTLRRISQGGSHRYLCRDKEYDSEDVLVRVLVSYTAQDGQSYENASYIGDLSRCREGMQMNVYYLRTATEATSIQRRATLALRL